MAEYPLIDIDLSGKAKKKPKGKPKISFRRPAQKEKKPGKIPTAKIQAPTIGKEQLATILMVLIILASLGWVGWQYSVLNQQERQEKDLLAQRKREYQRLKPIDEKLKLLEKKKKALITKVNTIKNLSADRREVPEVFNEWERIIPDTLWITSFNFTPGKTLSIKGYALTEADIAKFIDSLRQSPHYGGYNLGYVKSITMAGVPMKEFTLSLTSTPPNRVKVPNKKGANKKVKK